MAFLKERVVLADNRIETMMSKVAGKVLTWKGGCYSLKFEGDILASARH